MEPSYNHDAEWMQFRRAPCPTAPSLPPLVASSWVWLCWGSPSHLPGQPPPRCSVTATPPIALALGMSHSCALVDGGVRCWGFGPLTGIAGGNDQPVPVQVTGPGSGVQAVVAGNRHTCALLGDGTVRCWGKGESGQLGNGASADSATPVAVIGSQGYASWRPATITRAPCSTPEVPVLGSQREWAARRRRRSWINQQRAGRGGRPERRAVPDRG